MNVIFFVVNCHMNFISLEGVNENDHDRKIVESEIERDEYGVLFVIFFEEIITND